MKSSVSTPPTCPCGSQAYAGCCGPLHAGNIATTAEALMRSRYSAYVMKLGTYLRNTWHPDTCPATLDVSSDTAQWLGLQVLRHEKMGTDKAIVEFVARYKINGRAHRLHEISRFVRKDGRWLYVDGELSS